MNGKYHSIFQSKDSFICAYFEWLPPALKTVLLLTIMFIVVSAGYAQQITIQAKNESFIVVLKNIAKQANHELIVSTTHVQKAKPVTLKLERVTIIEALNELFKGQPLTYEIKGKTVSVKDKEVLNSNPVSNSRTNQQAVTGRVVDSIGNPLARVSISLKGEANKTLSDENGYFNIQAEAGQILSISILGYQPREIVATTPLKDIQLDLYHKGISEVLVINTGYQSIPKERAVGSYVQVDNKLLNRAVSTNILDRLNGIVAGLTTDNISNPNNGEIQTNPNNRSSGLTIRGKSTFLSSSDPLIVVDNFPFEGELSSINPNDIENITILKDASAASIWGARSGNGVIVITTKRGKQNESIKLDFSSNLTVADKPNVFYSPRYIDSKNFIDIEQYLFDQGYFNSDLSDNSTYPVVSPAVEIMSLVKAGTITPTEGQSRLEVLRNLDVRNDWKKYVYQNAINQQYSLAMHGGTGNITYRLSGGYDKNKDEFVRNGMDRITINSLNTYRPFKNMEILAGINFAKSNTDLNNRFDQYNLGSSKYGPFLPYSMLADENGDPLAILNGYREEFLEQSAQQGFKDWRFRPLDEIEIADNSTKVNSILGKIGATYKILPELSASINYQIEQQNIANRNHQTQDTYYVRNLFNRFSVYNSTTKVLTSNFPKGGVLDLINYTWTSWNFRSQFNYNKSIGLHNITALAGFESRELKTEGSGQTLLGYDDQFGTSNMALNYVTSFPTTPAGTSRLPGPSGRIYGLVNRFVSYYANGSYNYNDRYTVTGSVRTDGANLFGAKVNNRFSPLWSMGVGWKVSNESFYNSTTIPILNFRASFGFNGNTYRYGTALLTGRYGTASLTGAPSIVSLTAPNPELSWERVKNLNLGIDFSLKDNFIIGTIEYYFKTGIDLVQPTELAPQTGFSSYTANTAKTSTKGLDLNLTFNWFQNAFQWKTIFLYSLVKDKVLKYDAPFTSISGFGGIIGRPLNSLFAYRWEGLNPENGNPIGWYEGAKSENYAAIISSLKEEDIIYSGNRTPTSFGSLRNDFAYKGLDLSFNITYFLGYNFRRGSIEPSYTTLLNGQRHSDYLNRWQKPGDELNTNVPSLTYPENYGRTSFYQLSEALITSGDHIRLQDLRLGYDLNNLIRTQKLRLNAFIYGNNIGIIWRKNKNGIDPSVTTYPVPRTYSIGINANF